MVGEVVGAMVEMDWARVSIGERMLGRRPEEGASAIGARACSMLRTSSCDVSRDGCTSADVSAPMNRANATVLNDFGVSQSIAEDRCGRSRTLLHREEAA